MFVATPWLEGAADRRGMFLADGGHLSPEGHGVVAAGLEPAVIELLRN